MLNTDIEALTAFVALSLAELVKAGALPADTMGDIAAANETIAATDDGTYGGDLARRIAELARMTHLIATRGAPANLRLVDDAEDDPAE